MGLKTVRKGQGKEMKFLHIFFVFLCRKDLLFFFNASNFKNNDCGGMQVECSLFLNDHNL